MTASLGEGLSLTGCALHRLWHKIPIALRVSAPAFFLIHLVPGDPARTML